MLTRVRRGAMTVLSTTFVLALVAAGLWLQAPKLRDHHDRRQMLLSLLAQRTPVTKILVIRVSVNGEDRPLLGDPAYTNPLRWERTITVWSTDRVMMQVTQDHGGLVACSMWRRDLPEGTLRVVDDSQRTDPGSVRCYMNR